MSALSCPACGLQQTLASPRCARCGALLTGPAPVPFDAGAADDRTVLRDALPLPPASSPSDAGATAKIPARFGTQDAAPGQPNLTWTPDQQPAAPNRPGLWRRIWKRVMDGPQEATQDPRGDVPNQSPGT